MDEEKINFYLQTYGYVPWTVVIANALEMGTPWDTGSIVEQLRAAQERIDELTLALKEKNR